MLAYTCSGFAPEIKKFRWRKRKISLTSPDIMKKMKHATPAGIGIGHAGPRYTTTAFLDFQEKQLRAHDAVMQEVPEEVVKNLGVFERLPALTRDFSHELAGRRI